MMSPYRKPALAPPDLSEDKFKETLRKVQEAFRLMSLCKCRQGLVREGPRSYGITIRDNCPLHRDI